VGAVGRRILKKKNVRVCGCGTWAKAQFLSQAACFQQGNLDGNSKKAFINEIETRERKDKQKVCFYLNENERCESLLMLQTKVLYLADLPAKRPWGELMKATFPQ